MTPVRSAPSDSRATCASQRSPKPFANAASSTAAKLTFVNASGTRLHPSVAASLQRPSLTDAETRSLAELGSVLNHVLLHQSVIGQEAMTQMEHAGAQPDVIIGCVGGGSNFAGIAFPFLEAALANGRQVRFLAAEPAACPTLTRGAYRYDFGDTSGLTPLMPMYTLGHDFVPPPVHAGGLRYHGDSPLLSALVKNGLIEVRAFHQNETFDAALRFARSEGIIPAPEAAHAIRAVIEEAEAATQAGEEQTILFNLSGHGHFDLSAYDAYLAGELEDPEFSQADMEAALGRLPEAPAIA